MMRRIFRNPMLALAFLLLATVATAQEDYGARLGQQQGDRFVYRVSGVPIYTDALDPTIQRWYLPPTLFGENGRYNQWDYTNFAANPNRRYLDRGLEGDYYYDVYGNVTTLGWILYDWRQVQPTPFASNQVFKASRYVNDFRRLIISTDTKGGNGFSIIVGDEIRTTLTPMTFRKAGFNGVQAHFSSDRFRVTGLFSRLSTPLLGATRSVANDFTNLAGGRAEADITDNVTLGATFLNAHNNTGSSKAFKGNVFNGALTVGQLSQRLDLLVLRLSDDSPEDNEGGALLISQNLEISTTLMREMTVEDSVVLVPVDTVITSSSLDFQPTFEGGDVVEGFLVANGAESVVLKYNFVPTAQAGEAGTLRAKLQEQFGLTLAEAEDAITAIDNVRIRLVLANDYRVEMSSSRQTDGDGVPQFVLVERAEGNIKNQLNQREVIFDYGLPTANQIYGLTAAVRDFHGFDLYSEVNINTRYRKYPAISRKTHQAISGIKDNAHALGWMLNASWQRGPWFVFGEGFGMEDGYSTSIQPVSREGLIDFSPDATNLTYDFVDDNDDQDRQPDQLRFAEGSLVPRRDNPNIEIRGLPDQAVFPGYDENHDFISDFNQNSTPERENFFPDYDEPFLRYRSDRPEFLFGMDLNNNGWVERFENDDLPDYPYRKDHWGYNINAGAEIIPGIEAKVGQLRQEMQKTARENVTTYGLFTLDQNGPTWGRLRVFDMFKKAEDTIADDLRQWVIPRTEFGQASVTSGRNQEVLDRLAATDTWINTFYTDWTYASAAGWRTEHRFKWETWRQRDDKVEFVLDTEGNRVLDEEGAPVVAFDPLGPDGRNGRDESGFTGLINKAEYHFQWKKLAISPRFKSEWLRETPFSLELEKRRSWDGIFFLQLQLPILRSTRVHAGIEQRFFSNLRGDEKELLAQSLSGDFRGTVYALQITNRRSYQGYDLITQVGMRIDRRSLEVIEGPRDTETTGLFFLSMFASLGE